MKAPAPTHHTSNFVRVDAAALMDGSGFFAAPGSVLFEVHTSPDVGGQGWHTRTLAVGQTSDVLSHPANQYAEVIGCPDSVVIPGLVNAHTHLDLTHLGPRPHNPDQGFVPWINMIRDGRHTDAAMISDSVRSGLALSLAGGTVAIGDIAGAPMGRPSLVPWRTRSAAGIRGISFLEFFGIGKGAARGLEAITDTLMAAALDATSGNGLGIQPHAPNTVALGVYAEAINRARQILGPSVRSCTHLAESAEEHEFVANARGPQREMLESLGMWDDAMLAEIGLGRSPVEHLSKVLGQAPMLVAHVNDADDRAIEILAHARASVVHCPHASSYFGASRHFGPHRYRAMLNAGITVALGTDSIVNLPHDSVSPSVGMSILKEMALLHQRDGTDPSTLLRMGTINGALTLGLEPAAFKFGIGHPIAGLNKVGIGTTSLHEVPHESVVGKDLLGGSRTLQLLFIDTISGLTRTYTP